MKNISPGAARGMVATFFGLLVLVVGWGMGYFDAPDRVDSREPDSSSSYGRRNLHEIGYDSGGGNSEEETVIEVATPNDPSASPDASVDSETFFLAPEHFLTNATAHFELKFDPHDAGIVARVPEIQMALDEAYSVVSALFALHPEKRTEVILLRHSANDTAEWAAGLYDGRIRLFLSDTTPLATLQRTMQHEHLHACLHNLGIRMPTWLNEGLAETAAEIPADDARRYLLARELPSLSELEGNWTNWQGGERVTVAYSYAISFVAWVSEEYGESALQLLLQRGQSMPLEDAVMQTYGSSLSFLESSHRDWLTSRR